VVGDTGGDAGEGAGDAAGCCRSNPRTEAGVSLRSPPRCGWFCAGWKAIHDAMVTRLVLRHAGEAIPGVAVELKGEYPQGTRFGQGAPSSEPHPCAHVSPPQWMLEGDGQGAASSGQPPRARLPRPQRLHQGDGVQALRTTAPCQPGKSKSRAPNGTRSNCPRSCVLAFPLYHLRCALPSTSSARHTSLQLVH
jgi:hypothetical protein